MNTTVALRLADQRDHDVTEALIISILEHCFVLHLNIGHMVEQWITARS